jgi:hypothetical protein
MGGIGEIDGEVNTYAGRVCAVALVAVGAFTDYTAVNVSGLLLDWDCVVGLYFMD